MVFKMADIMDMKPLLLIIMCTLLFAQNVSGIEISIAIKQNVTGTFRTFDVLPHTPQTFHVMWSNTGTSACISISRITIFSNTTRALTLWSRPVQLMPSQDADWHLYSNLPAGNYTAYLRVYHCNEVFNHMPLEFSVPVAQPPENRLEIVRYSVNSTAIKLVVKNTAPSESTNTAIIPKNIPPGWIVSQPPTKTIPPGETTTFVLPADIKVHVHRNITIDAVSQDGRFSGTGNIEISPPFTTIKTEDHELFYALALLCAFTAALFIIFLYHKKIKFSWKKQ